MLVNERNLFLIWTFSLIAAKTEKLMASSSGALQIHTAEWQQNDSGMTAEWQQNDSGMIAEWQRNDIEVTAD